MGQVLHGSRISLRDTANDMRLCRTIRDSTVLVRVWSPYGIPYRNFDLSDPGQRGASESSNRSALPSLRTYHSGLGRFCSKAKKFANTLTTVLRRKRDIPDSESPTNTSSEYPRQISCDIHQLDHPFGSSSSAFARGRVDRDKVLHHVRQIRVPHELERASIPVLPDISSQRSHTVSFTLCFPLVRQN